MNKYVKLINIEFIEELHFNCSISLIKFLHFVDRVPTYILLSKRSVEIQLKKQDYKT